MTDEPPLVTPTVEVVPIAIGVYAHHPHLDVEPEVSRVSELLSSFGGVEVGWSTPAAERGNDAVGQRLTRWSTSPPADAVLYWVGHGESDGRSAYLAHTHSPNPVGSEGIDPGRLARHLARREGAVDEDDAPWTIVVVDACKSTRFVELLSAVVDDLQGARRMLLIGTSGEGSAMLGRFTAALETALRDTYRANHEIELWDLAKQLKRQLSDAAVVAKTVQSAVLRRRGPLPAGLAATVDVVADIEAVLATLSDDEIRHFVPKAQGAELGEISWYFEGRQSEHRRIGTWLREQTRGLLVVTGNAGSGKSALLGNVLVHTRRPLRDTLVRHRLVSPLPTDQQPPYDVFDAVLHLTGLTVPDAVRRLAADLDIGEPPTSDTPSHHVDWLHDRLTSARRPATILMDALDEAVEPLLTARVLIRRLAGLPRVRILLGTRRSTSEGPDRPAPTDRDLLDAIGADDGSLLVVERDEQALTRYVRNRLIAASRTAGPAVDPGTVAEVSAGIGASGQEFLFARLAVHELLTQPGLVGSAGAEARARLLRSDHRTLFATAVERLASADAAYRPLLTALALACGRGLPIRDGVWAAVARAVDPGPPVVDVAITALLRDAAPYLMLDSEHAQTVYRLAHRTFQEHLTRDASRTARHHDLVARALVAHAERAVGEDPNRYVTTYTSAHAAAAGRAGWEHLADHPGVLDRLSSRAVAADAMRTAFARFPLPAEIAAVIGASHRLTTAPPRDRPGLRQLGMARHADVTRPAARPHEDPGSAWSVLWADLRQQPTHLTLTGHAGAVTSLAAFTDGQAQARLATGGTDHTIRIWDPVTGELLRTVHRHRASITAIAAFDGGDGRTLLAVGSADGSVQVWDPATGAHLDDLYAHQGRVHAIVPFAGRLGPSLATGGRGGLLRVYQTAAGRRGTPYLSWDAGSVDSIAAFTAADGTARLATDDGGGTVRIWDPFTGKRIGPALADRTDWVRTVAAFVGPRGRPLLATGGGDGVVRIWDPTTGRRVGRDMTGARDYVYVIAAFAGADRGPLLATSGATGTIHIWDPTTGRRGATELVGHSSIVLTITAFAGPDRRPLLATGGADGTVRIWDPTAGQRKGMQPRERIGGVRAVAAFHDAGGKPLVALAGVDDTLRLIDCAGEWTSPKPAGHAHALATFSDGTGRQLLAIGDRDGGIHILDTARRKRFTVRFTNHPGPVVAVAPFAGVDGRLRVAAADIHHDLRIVDPDRHSQTSIPWTGDPVTALVALTVQDGRQMLAVLDSDRQLYLIDASEDAAGRPAAVQLTGVTAMAPYDGGEDGPLLAVGRHDGMISLVDPATGGQLGSLSPVSGGPVRAIAQLPTTGEAPLLVAGGAGGGVRFVEPTTTLMLPGAQLGSPVNSISPVSISAVGIDIAVGTEDGAVLLRFRAPGRPDPRETVHHLR